MLTLKEPIRLQSAAGVIPAQDAFSDRIRDNYSLLAAQFTPKELLLLMTEPPEEEPETPGMTTLVTQNNVTVRHGLTLEVLNSIVNRIMLTQNAPFTYQDTVYISNMLRKAGVTDVALFMRQVRQLFEQGDSVARLTALYQTMQSLRHDRQGSEAAVRPQSGVPDQLPDAAARSERYFLHSEIYHRLQTAAIYREFNALMTAATAVVDRVEAREMLLAEHFRMSEQLRLAELRQRMVDRDSPMTLQYVQNHYEQGDLLPVPENETQVFSRLAEAVLLSTVDKTLTIAAKRGMAGGAWTLDLRHALQQSIDNTVFRFENGHETAVQRGGDTLFVDESRSSLLTQEYTLLEQILHRMEDRQETVIRSGDTLLQQTQNALSLSLRGVESGGQPLRPPVEFLREMLREVLHAERLVDAPGSVVRRAALQLGSRISALLGGGAARVDARVVLPPDTSNISPAELLHDLSGSGTETELLREQFDRLDETTRTLLERRYQERVREVRQRTGELKETELQHILTETLRSVETAEHERQETESVRSISRSDTLARGTRQVLERMQRMRTVYESEHTAAQTTVEQTEHTLQSDHELTLTQRETEQIDSHTLREQLDLIDRRNREILERVRNARIREIEQKRTEVRRGDTGRVINDALRALDDPRQVLAELLAQPVSQAKPLDLSPDARTLLSQADEATRHMLETVMQYESNPSAPLPVQMQTASPALLNAQVAAAGFEEEAQQTQAVIQTDEQQRELLREAAHTAAQYAMPREVRRREEGDGRRPPEPVHFVHKTEQHVVDESLLERIEQQRQTVRQIEETQVDEQQGRIETQQIDRTLQRTIEKTGEDVTELINRTLARQLGTISDKVYSQMEKRLRLERARRGR